MAGILGGYSRAHSQSQDIYGNLKIPVATSAKSDLQAGGTSNYSSILGYPLWISKEKEGDDTQKTTSSMITSYFVFNCSEFVSTHPDSEIMQAHNLIYDDSRTLTISAENNTEGTY